MFKPKFAAHGGLDKSNILIAKKKKLKNNFEHTMLPYSGVK
jgi:hypothetical protein